LKQKRDVYQEDNMSKVTAQTPEGDRIHIADTQEDAEGFVQQGKNDNPDLTKWEIDGKPIKLTNADTGEVDE
jgi:hypothetical protein